jgi:mannose-6-phosphate isomerase-like protein (cupin superfamily)
MEAMLKVNLTEKLDLIDEYWSPKLVGELNNQVVKLAKLKGEFTWHKHDTEDEMFLVIKGRLMIKFRDQDITLEGGEFLIVPRGVEHKPIAEQEAHIMLFEPATTINTGDVRNELTKDKIERI